MEKNITLQQSDIRVINAKQVQTSALLDGMKKAATAPVEWLRQYYSSVLEREVTMVRLCATCMRSLLSLCAYSLRTTRCLCISAYALGCCGRC